MISNAGHVRAWPRVDKTHDRLRFRGLRRLVHQDEAIEEVP